MEASDVKIERSAAASLHRSERKKEATDRFVTDKTRKELLHRFEVSFEDLFKERVGYSG